jgi:peptidoglycan/LPS O-acetylase OafA/YrhL
MAAIIIIFFMMVFFADRITYRLLEPFKSLVYGGASIFVIFSFFYKYQDSFSQDKHFGWVMQYIGRRTLDIYMIHYFLLPFRLDMMGQWFTNNPNPTIEFFITTAIAAMVISLSIVIGNIIRLSHTLSYYLMGGKNNR